MGDIDSGEHSRETAIAAMLEILQESDKRPRTGAAFQG